MLEIYRGEMCVEDMIAKLLDRDYLQCNIFYKGMI